jgi:hypothetical protein
VVFEDDIPRVDICPDAFRADILERLLEPSHVDLRFTADVYAAQEGNVNHPLRVTAFCRRAITWLGGSMRMLCLVIRSPQ